MRTSGVGDTSRANDMLCVSSSEDYLQTLDPHILPSRNWNEKEQNQREQLVKLGHPVTQVLDCNANALIYTL